MSEKKWWHTHDHHSPTLTKASLGEFFYHVLTNGAIVGQVWAFAKYPRSSVFMTIEATDEQKDAIEKATKFKFKPPPQITLS